MTFLHLLKIVNGLGTCIGFFLVTGSFYEKVNQEPKKWKTVYGNVLYIIKEKTLKFNVEKSLALYYFYTKSYKGLKLSN